MTIRDLGVVGNVVMCGLFVLVSLPLTVGCVVLAMCCGFIYGFWIGSLTACVGLVLGGLVSYWSLNKVQRQRIERPVPRVHSRATCL